MIGIDASTSTNTQARALTSLASTIANDEIGVTARRSSVWRSRSPLIATDVDAGASTATISVCSMSRPTKMPRPTVAEAKDTVPQPMQLLRLNASSFIRWSIQPITASTTR